MTVIRTKLGCNAPLFLALGVARALFRTLHGGTLGLPTCEYAKCDVTTEEKKSLGKVFLRRKRRCLQGLSFLVQVQVRMPEKSVQEIDRWVAEGRFASRSEAIKTIVAMHQERERTREFYKLLLERSREAKEKPEILLSLEEVS